MAAILNFWRPSCLLHIFEMATKQNLVLLFFSENVDILHNIVAQNFPRNFFFRHYLSHYWAAVAVSVEVLVFIVIGRSCSKGCGFVSHCRPGSFHRYLILGLQCRLSTARCEIRGCGDCPSGNCGR